MKITCVLIPSHVLVCLMRYYKLLYILIYPQFFKYSQINVGKV